MGGEGASGHQSGLREQRGPEDGGLGGGEDRAQDGPGSFEGGRAAVQRRQGPVGRDPWICVERILVPSRQQISSPTCSPWSPCGALLSLWSIYDFSGMRLRIGWKGDLRRFLRNDTVFSGTTCHLGMIFGCSLTWPSRAPISL